MKAMEGMEGPTPMRALSDWPLDARRGIAGIFTDIDDTLTTEGAITPDALQAMGELKAAGLQVVAITGRPVGWSEPFAAAWPVDAIVAENGAVAPGSCRSFFKQKWPAAPTGRAHAAYQNCTSRTPRPAPPTTRACRPCWRAWSARFRARGAPTDSPGRECDIAVDHSEFTHLGQAQIDAVVALMRGEGMHATVSSIHINGWYGEHNKLEGARWIVRTLWQRDLDTELGRWAYVGDSTNDQLMFEAFPHSIGVANIARFVPQLAHLPRYVTRGERGAGFTEVARAVLAAR